MPDHNQLPHIAEAQRTPLVEQLLEQIEHLLEENRRQAEPIQQLRDEIAVLKGQKAKPKCKPSGMETETEAGGDADGADEGDSGGDEVTPRRPRKRPGLSKRRKLLHEQLRKWGIDISVGQIDALLSGATEDFLLEKDQLLITGLAVSRYITVDDSGARHQGNNGYVTQIGNDWFASTGSKSRINFLQLLHAGNLTYTLNAHALSYFQEERLPKEPLRRLQAHTQATISHVACWEAHLDALGIERECHRRIATEGALLGGLIEKGFALDLAIVSDGARQFAILLHALCWVHAERLVHKLIPLNAQQREDQERVRGEIWELYADLKAYQRNPDPALVPTLTARFDAIFTQRTAFATLNQTLKRLHGHKEKLLLVLKRPDIVLHTNGSEGDIRDYVKWRKISGGTRSDPGKRCRDGFASLKKTCRKLGISFWDYLGDRINGHGTIAPLPDIIRERAAAASTVP